MDTSSDYEDPHHPLCLPKVIVLLHIIKQYGSDYFDSIRNRDIEKTNFLLFMGIRCRMI